MSVDSSRTTGGDPIEGVDPGGTRPKPAETGKTAPGKPTSAPPVTSGDRNRRTSSDLGGGTRTKLPGSRPV